MFPFVCRLVGIGIEQVFGPDGAGRAGQQRRPTGFGGQRLVGREADARADRAQREAAAHVADVLLGQPAAGRPHEGTTGRDDRPESARHTRVVPEQTVQGQETGNRSQTADTAGQGELLCPDHVPNVAPPPVFPIRGEFRERPFRPASQRRRVLRSFFPCHVFRILLLFSNRFQAKQESQLWYVSIFRVCHIIGRCPNSVTTLCNTIELGQKSALNIIPMSQIINFCRLLHSFFLKKDRGLIHFGFIIYRPTIKRHTTNNNSNDYFI